MRRRSRQNHEHSWTSVPQIAATCKHTLARKGLGTSRQNDSQSRGVATGACDSRKPCSFRAGSGRRRLALPGSGMTDVERRRLHTSSVSTARLRLSTVNEAEHLSYIRSLCRALIGKSIGMAISLGSTKVNCCSHLFDYAFSLTRMISGIPTCTHSAHAITFRLSILKANHRSLT